MRIILGYVLAILVSANVSAQAPLQFESAAQRVRFQELTENLRCLVCQNQSLASSSAPLARELRVEILAMMQQGKSDDDIRNFLVQRYGEFVLYDPPMQPGTWALWFGPLAVLIAGGIGLGMALKRRAMRSNP